MRRGSEICQKGSFYHCHLTVEYGSFIQQKLALSVGKNVQFVQTHLNFNILEITQSYLIQWFTSRTISLKLQNQDSKFAVEMRIRLSSPLARLSAGL